MVSNAIRHSVKAMLPDRVLQWIRQRRERWDGASLLQRSVWDVSLRRVRPLRRAFGWRKGRPVDRYYIESFLARWSEDIRGHVLEIGDNTYTRRFGREQVIQSEVLHAKHGNDQATIVASLADGEGIPSESFDCIILTQTLQFIYNIRGALSTLARILRPGGVLLATFPGTSQIARYDMNEWGEYWRFTTLSARELFGEAFPVENLTVEAHGNVLATIALLHGIVTEELRPEELDYWDPDYELSICVRAVRPAGD